MKGTVEVQPVETPRPAAPGTLGLRTQLPGRCITADTFGPLQREATEPTQKQ